MTKYEPVTRWQARACATLAAIAMTAAPGAALAEPGALSPVVMGGTLILTLQTDRTLKEAGGVDPFTNTYSEPEFAWFAHFGQHLSLNGLFKMEQVRDVSSTGAFEEQGAWIDELYGTVSFDPVKVYGGKIHPRFGVAWDATPGLYGTDMAEDYELTEKIGVGVAYEIDHFGVHTVAAELFQADTTFLSSSIITRPGIDDPNLGRVGRARRSHGGPSNTDGLESYGFTLSGEKIPGLEGLSYNIGMASQHGSDALGERTERSYVAGVAWAFAVSDGMTAKPIFEWARVENQGGLDQTADYYTLGSALELGRGWFVAAHATIKPVDDDATPDSFTDRMYGVSVGYDLGGVLKQQAPLLEGLGVEVGFKHEDIARETQNTAGIALVYERTF